MADNLPKEFYDLVLRCANDTSIVGEFDKRRKAGDAVVVSSDAAQFIKFVYINIWLRLPRNMD